MCDIGMALSVAGGLAKAQSQNAYTNAVNQANKDAFLLSQRAREDERGRQNLFEEEATQSWADTLGELTPEKSAESRGENSLQLTDLLNERPGGIEQGFQPEIADTSEVVKTAAARKTNAVTQDVIKRIKALADLSAYNTTGSERREELTNTGDFLSTINGLRRGSLGVSQQEQTIPAATVRPGSSLFGDILSGAGGIMSGGGFGGLGGGGGGGFGFAGLDGLGGPTPFGYVQPPNSVAPTFD